MSRFTKIAPRLPVTDLATSVAFYNNVLHFAVGLSWPGEKPYFAILERDHVQVQLIKADAATTGAAGSATISIDVNRNRRCPSELKEQTAIEWGPEVYWYGRREFAVRDKSGNLLIFSEPTDDPPTCVDES